jgi:hypothetical protein
VAEVSAAHRESRDLWIGIGATAIALGAMAVDHLLGDEPGADEEGLVDPVAFVITAGLSIAAAVMLFGLVVPPARARGPERAANVGLACSMISLVPGFLSLWLGVPFVVAGAGIALGLTGLAGRRRNRAIAALVAGWTQIVLGSAIYAAAAVERLT